MSAAVEINQQIRSDIEKGIYPAGSALPGIRELCRRFSCSATTVSKAIEMLASEEIVEIRRGRKGGIIVFESKKSSVADENTLSLSFSASDRTKPVDSLLLSMIQAFQQEHPDVSFEYTSDWSEKNSFETRALDFTSESAPSLVKVPLNYIPLLAAFNLIKPVADYSDTAKTDKIELHDSVKPYIVRNNMLFGAATHLSPSLVLMGNKKVMQKRGLLSAGDNLDLNAILNKKQDSKESKAIGLLNAENFVLMWLALTLRSCSNEIQLHEPRGWGALLFDEAALDSLRFIKKWQEKFGIVKVKANYGQLFNHFKNPGHDEPCIYVVHFNKAVELSTITPNPESIWTESFPSQQTCPGKVMSNTMAWVLTDENKKKSTLEFFNWLQRPDIWHLYSQKCAVLGRPAVRSAFADEKDFSDNLNEELNPVEAAKESFSQNGIEVEPALPFGLRPAFAEIFNEWLTGSIPEPESAIETLQNIWQKSGQSAV
ncbi:MAG: GntR family transcriptional regulator [Planctomycetota bacterium]|jgi:ABC-type glycerol-3-phosphate transport system substrate-binding protein